MNLERNTDNFLNTITFIKLTEARRFKLHSEGWGMLTDYSLESVKISRYKGRVISSATLRISDRSGQVTCVVKGPCTGLLFGLTIDEWKEVENMCNSGEQLFYRYFKNGINKSFNIEQQLFYNFCMANQYSDGVFVAKYRRNVNKRNKFKSDAFLDILELRKCENNLLDIYISQLRKGTNEILQTN